VYMATIFMPTKNRSSSLERVLAFFARTAPGFAMVIADGSNPEFTKKNRTVIDSFASKLNIELRQYDEATPMRERVVDGLEGIDDEFVAMGADDDFLDVGIIERGESFLKTHPDYVVAMGYRVDLDLRLREYVRATLFHAFSIEMDDVLERLNHYTGWSYATTYSVSRKQHLLERYRKLFSMDFRRFDPDAEFPMIYGFNDYILGIFDLLCGKIKVFPELSCVSTKLPGMNYMRSYDPLGHLEQSEGILYLRDVLTDELIKCCGYSEKHAHYQSSMLLRKRLGELLGANLTSRYDFISSSYFKDQDVILQLREFNWMFEKSTGEGSPSSNLLEAAHEFLLHMTDGDASSAYAGLRFNGCARGGDLSTPIIEEEVVRYKYLAPKTLEELEELPTGAVLR